jgi:hypothetical protein
MLSEASLQRNKKPRRATQGGVVRVQFDNEFDVIGSGRLLRARAAANGDSSFASFR